MWFIRQEVLDAMVRAHEARSFPTAKEVAAYEAEIRAEVEANGGLPRNLRIAGDTAEIRVEGALTPKPDLFARWFGGGNTTYEEIRQSIAMAENDPAVKKLVFHVDSPGGHVAGLFDTLAAIQSTRKARSVVAAYACSAAYAISAVAGKIQATNAAVEVGSIGVAVTYFHIPEFIDITSTLAPKKRPDPSTDEGKAVIREHLDAIHDLFVDAIAAGRGVSVKTVNEEFGEGAVVLAAAAKKQGMIDSIARPQLRSVLTTPDPPDGSVDENPPTAQRGTVQEKKKMDLETLKKDHPELYAAILEEGSKAGAAAERKRVNAHLKMGKSHDAMDIALKAIESGVSVSDEECLADYLSARANKKDSDARQSDSDNSDPGSPAPAAADAPDLGDQVVALLEKKYPKKAS